MSADGEPLDDVTEDELHRALWEGTSDFLARNPGALRGVGGGAEDLRAAVEDFRRARG